MNRQALPDRQQLESALQQVSCGELSLAEATQMLLDGESPHTRDSSNRGGLATDREARRAGETESLASLIDRLGNPPADIVHAWCQQIGKVAAIHESETSEPLPLIRLTQWRIDASGQLSWNHRRFAIEQDAAASPKMQVSLDHLDQFRKTLLPDHAGATDTVAHPARNVPAWLTSPDRIGEKDERRFERTPLDQGPTKIKKPFRRLAIAAVLLGCGAVLSAMLFLAWRAKPIPVANSGPSPADSAPKHSNSPNVDPIAANALELPSLQTFDTVDAAAIEDLADASLPMPSLSLGAMMPNATDFLPRKDASSQQALPNHSGLMGQHPADENAPDNQHSETQEETDAVEDSSTMKEEVLPEELPQKTRAASVTAIDLPPVNDSSERLELWETSTSEMRLEFPFEVPLVLRSSETGWTIRDDRKDVPVALINRDAQLTQLHWHARATESSNASALSHGRLINEAGSTIYLRPLLESDPWTIRLDQFDVRPTWDLHHPIPPRVARLSLQFDLPDGIELAWIEAIDPTAIRRARGLAMLMHEESETVALGMRLDVRCGKKLSCRIRFAARLDPTMPWQTVSTSSLAQFADQLTLRATAISRETARLAALDGRVDSQSRRALRIDQEQVNSQAATIRVASQRVAQLQSLITLLESEASMKLGVWVQWPDQRQTILEMKSDEH